MSRNFQELFDRIYKINMIFKLNRIDLMILKNPVHLVNPV